MASWRPRYSQILWVDFGKNWKLLFKTVVKNSLTIISNDLGFKVFNLNQVIDEVKLFRTTCFFPGILFYK